MSATTMTATALPLLHVWEGAVQAEKGLFTLVDGRSIPGAWEPRPDQYESKAIPTPFARAEAMRLILQRIDEAGTHPFGAQFQYLLLGVAAGVLALEPDSLAHPKFDNLGRALRQVDEDARYFCHVEWARDGRTRGFGLTYRTSLFSPHARRAPAEWNELADAIKPKEKPALELVGQWRAALQRADRWSPELRGCEWQRGVDHVLRGIAVSPGAPLELLHEHARLVGPVWLCVPTGRAEEPVRQEPLYLPQLAPDFARRFNESCRFRPRAAPERGGIVFVDAGNQEVARIRIPAAGTDPHPIALGMGVLELHSVPTTPSAAVEDWIRGRGGEPGLVELLRPVELALQKLGRPLTAGHVNGCPPLYPDPIRILFERGLWPAPGGERTIESRALTDARIQAGGRALDPAALARQGGELVALGGEGARVSLAMVDRVGDTPVNDLRALGFVLWSIFTREAEISSELGGQLAMSDTLEKLLEHSLERPLEPTRRVYERVAGEPPELLRRRLATLQRFAKAYSRLEPGLPRLFDRAARSFAAWASGRTEPVENRIGRPPARYLSFRIPTGEELTLALDALDL
jgi:hypothetical protein